MKFKVQNNVTSLKDVKIPDDCTELYCFDTQITSLEHCPPTLQILYCNNIQITSLEHCPPTLQTLYCNNTQITSLDHIPSFSQLNYVTGFTEDKLKQHKRLVNAVFKMQVRWR